MKKRIVGTGPGSIGQRRIVLICLLAAALFSLQGCVAGQKTTSALLVAPQPLAEHEGLLTIFVQLAGQEGGEAWLEVSSVELVGEAAVVALAGGNRALAAAEIGDGQRFVARGPVPAGRYDFLRLTLDKAALQRDGKKILLTLEQPIVDMPLPGDFQMEAGDSRTLIISWDDEASLVNEAHFSARMALLSPRRPLLADLAYVSCPDIDTLYLLSTDRNRVSGSLAIKGRPTYMAYAPQRKRLYVLSEEQSTITVVETATSRIVDRFKIPMTVAPSFFMSPDGNRGYILDGGGNYLTLMDLNQGAMIQRQRLGYQPRHLIWHAAGRQLILSSGLDQKIYFLDAETLATRDVLPVGSSPDGLLVDDDYLFVAEQSANSLSIFDLDRGQEVKRLQVGLWPRRILKNNNTLYVSNYRSSSVSLVLVRQQRVARTIAVADGPLEMVSANHSKWIYVAGRQGGAITVIDQTSNRPAALIELAAKPADLLVVQE